MRKIVVWALAFIIVAPLGVAALFPEDTARLAIDYERSRAALTAETLPIGDERWYFLVGGPKEGETLLLLHGFGGNKDNWVRLAGNFTDEYRVIIPDLPGFGDTARDRDRDYSMSRQADRLQRFVDALGLERFHIAGHSMGGYIAGIYAHRHPQHVETLTLVTNAGVSSPVESEVARMVAAGDNPLVPRTRGDFDRMLELASLEPPFVPWPVKGYLADQAIARADFLEYLFDFLRRDDAGLDARLPELEMPVFVLWGRHDRLLDVSTVEVIRGLVPDAEVVIMENTGHLPIIEAPQAAAAHYRAFLEKNTR